MPIREGEKFCKCFLADTEKEAEKLLKDYNSTLKLLSNKVAALTGLDKEDLYQEGIIGLARAKRDFDEERSENFKIFAIYKIKDAMREFGTTQAVTIKAPQYTKDAIRLASVLRELLVKAGEYPYIALVDMWNSSSKYVNNDPLEKSIQKARQSLKNLADRSHTSVRQLLERSEMIPTLAFAACKDSSMDIEDENPENTMVNNLDAAETISRIKEYLSEEDYNLLWNRYVEGMTVRELAPIMGISAPHVSDRTQALLEKVRKLEKDLRRKKAVLYESNTNTEETKPRHAG